MSRKKVAFLFPGQGAQYIGMGKDLYEQYPPAKAVYDRMNAVAGLDLKKVCFEGPETELKKTRFAQPAIFATSIAALEVFKTHPSWARIEAVATAGLSLGEATALVASEALNFEDGARFVRDRGLFMDEASEEKPGTMAAVLGLELETVEKICEETGAEIGNLNCPGQVVISGETERVQKAIGLCERQGAKRVVPLDVGGAFHSSCMNSASKKIQAALANAAIQKPKLGMYSNLTGTSETDPKNIKANLVRQMNHRTLWEKSMREMIQDGIGDFFEIGPGKVLKGLLRKIDSSVNVTTLGTVQDFDRLEKTFAKNQGVS